MIREIKENDLNDLLRLYKKLHNSVNVIPTDELSKLWHHIIVAIL